VPLEVAEKHEATKRALLGLVEEVHERNKGRTRPA
jgi:hypothetical protein